MDDLREHLLICETLKDQRGDGDNIGVKRGSFLGPDLRNTFYDNLLRLDMPKEPRLISYVDDVPAFVAGRRRKPELDILMRRVNECITDHSFSLVPEKTDKIVNPNSNPLSIGKLINS